MGMEEWQEHAILGEIVANIWEGGMAEYVG